MPFITFVTYLFPLSVGMFPHLFQHWLTARNVSQANCHRSPNLHNDCLGTMCPDWLVGEWTFTTGHSTPAVLSAMLSLLVGDPLLTGLLTAGVLAAIMSSLDSQFLCLGTVFTNDIVVYRAGKNAITDRQKLKNCQGVSLL